jgi:hypothetical protein
MMLEVEIMMTIIIENISEDDSDDCQTMAFFPNAASRRRNNNNKNKNQNKVKIIMILKVRIRMDQSIPMQLQQL